MKNYELWLDESGEFTEEYETQMDRNPSLVGGILIERGKIDDNIISELTSVREGEEFAHAMNYGSEEMENKVVPALESIVRSGGKLVYFENRERSTRDNNRELYLDLLARGLIQLMRKLAVEGEFTLDISLAQRRDIEAGNMIDDNEIISKINNYINEEIYNGILTLDRNSMINLSVQDARYEHHLMLADFACNTRLTRDSGKCKGVKNRLKKLFNRNAYIFSFSIFPVAEKIKSMAATGNLSNAFYELYTGYGINDHDMLAEELFNRFKEMSYRLQRIMLNTFVDNMVAFARNETEFKRGERIIKRVISELFEDYLTEIGDDRLQIDDAKFKLHFWLLDMYLREGNIIKAASVIRIMDGIVKGMNYRFENLEHLYWYNDRKALFQINCMEYRAAAETMDRSISTIKDMIDFADNNETIQKYFGGNKTVLCEHLGDAYCMKIYAEMFLQKSEPILYEESLKEDLKNGLRQYYYDGEKERTLQYFAHVEMVKGNIKEAISYLLHSAGIERDCINEAEEYTNKKIYVAYLEKATREDPLSRAYYFMYYVEIMLTAYNVGKDERKISKIMYDAITAQKKIRDILLSQEDRIGYHMSADVHTNIIANIWGDEQNTYHPVEIILWKYAMYLIIANKNTEEINSYFERATMICESNHDYIMMQIISLAIYLDWICYINEYNDSQRKKNKTISKIEFIITEIKGQIELYNNEIQEDDKKLIEMDKYVEEIKDFVNVIKRNGGVLSNEMEEQAKKLSGRIAF